MQNIYTIFDSKSASFAPPFLAPSDASCIRNLAIQLSNSQAQELPVVKFPGDFTLFCVGQWDESGVGLIPPDLGVPPKRSLGTIAEILSAFNLTQNPNEK